MKWTDFLPYRLNPNSLKKKYVTWIDFYVLKELVGRLNLLSKKTPCPDSFTEEFYQIFKKEIKQFCTNSSEIWKEYFLMTLFKLTWPFLPCTCHLSKLKAITWPFATIRAAILQWLYTVLWNSICRLLGPPLLGLRRPAAQFHRCLGDLGNSWSGAVQAKTHHPDRYAGRMPEHPHVTCRGLMASLHIHRHQRPGALLRGPQKRHHFAQMLAFSKSCKISMKLI